MPGMGLGMGIIFIWYRRPAAASGDVGTVFGVTAQAGNGTTTLSWSEAGNIDTVNIYRDDVLEDSVAGGTETWTSGALNDGLYTWHLVPVYDSEEGTPSTSKVFGNMSGDVWVDAVNGSNSNDGTGPGSAKATLRAAGSLVNSAGMRVVVRGGTYSEYNTKDNGGSTYGNAPVTTYTQDGTSESYCEFRSFPGENVIIDGSSITRPLGSGATDPNRPELFSIMGDYWLVAGWPGYPIHIQNSAGCGYRTRLSVGHIVEHVHSHDHEGSAFNMQESDDWIVRNCAGYSVYSTVNDGETADGVEAAGCDNCLVEDCFFAWCGDDGVDFITATNCTVQRTVVYRSNYFANGTTGNGNGNGFKLAHASNQNSGNIVLNCIAFECDSIGFDFNDGGALAAQCTSIGNRYGFAIGDSTDDGVVSMRENIAYNNSTTNILYNGVAPAIDAYNSWNTPPGVTVTSGDFTTLTFNTAWRSWDEVVAANFAALVGGSDMKAAGENGQDLGYEGEYAEGGGSIEIPNVGDNVYGGYFAGVIDTAAGTIDANDAYQTGRRYLLIVAPKSMDVAIDTNKQWTSAAADIPACETRWDGLASTAAMVSAGSTYEAANYVDGLTDEGDGHSVWYIPAMDELEVAYRAFKPTTTSNATSSDTNDFPTGAQTFGVNPSSDPAGTAYVSGTPAQTSVSAFQTGNAQAFNASTYMSSTQATNLTYWVQDFGDGWQFELSKTTSSSVRIRPVRRVYLDE